MESNEPNEATPLDQSKPNANLICQSLLLLRQQPSLHSLHCDSENRPIMATSSDGPDPTVGEPPTPRPPSFSDFPEDVQICVLSFLTASDVGSFACTCKRHLSLYRSDAKLWYAMCDRRWGSKTQIRKWGGGNIPYRLLYRNLSELENLIGFWRRSGRESPSSPAAASSPPPLVYFEWGPSFVAGARVSQSKLATYEVVKAPFLSISLSSRGEVVNFLHPDCRIDSSSSSSPSNLVDSADLGFWDVDLVPVSVKFIGKSYVVVEENHSPGCSYSCTTPEQVRIGYRRNSSSGSLRGEDAAVIGDVIGAESGSPPDRLMSEIYQYFANMTSPSGERASRRQRRREKERHGKRKWEPEHFVKIFNCSPTPSRPLQGLWKGICEDMSLEFYLVVYDDIGGITCRRVGDSSKSFSSYSPVFWTSDTTFTEPPFSPEEEYFYENRVHIQPHTKLNHTHGPLPSTEKVSRILCINSSYDLVIPDLAGKTNLRLVEGRIWQYVSGTFGFGFLRENFIIDLVHMAQHNHLLDAVELCSN